MKQLETRIISWLKKQIKDARAKGIVVGLSGGIDSAVVAVLAKKAVRQNMIGVIMPCGSHAQDEKDAKRLARKFGIKTVRVPLDGAFQMLKKKLPKGTRLADSNLKPRLRMTALYHIASSKNYLVAGTGNRSELMVGYFTKHGDGGVDILPIGGLYKTRVWALAEHLGIPKELIEKKPSAGLWKNQTDEGELGMSYAQLDECLAAMEKGNTRKITPAVLRKVKALVRNSAHKRSTVRMMVG